MPVALGVSSQTHQSLVGDSSNLPAASTLRDAGGGALAG